MTSTYARFFHLLPEPETVYNVIELGVHELEDTIPLLLHYPEEARHEAAEATLKDMI